MAGMNPTIINNRKYSKDSVHLVPIAPINYRRRSLAALSAFGTTANGSALQVVDSARRRLSNVGDVVSRKISNTIGWRTPSTPIDLIITQGSALCCHYIRNRLKRSRIFQRRLGLQRMRSAILPADALIVAEVYPALITLGIELENIQSNLFIKVARQAGSRLFSSEQIVIEVITDVSREMFRSGEMTWSKIVALYAIAGGIAVDCVHQDKAEFIPAIQRAMTTVLGNYLAIWIQANGGWGALAAKCRPNEPNSVWQEHAIVIGVIGATLLFGLLVILIRTIIC